MLKSAWVFSNSKSGFPMENLQEYTTEDTKEVNGVEENLTTQVFVNEVVLEKYIHCRVIVDEILDINGRAFNRELNQIIVQNKYDAYIDNETGLLICLCGKKSSSRIKLVFEKMLNISYNGFHFDLNMIMYDSSNVKRTTFTNLSIQTLSTGIIKGNRVNDTELFAELVRNGDLSNIIVAYPFGAEDINVSVSTSGSMILYSDLTDDEYVQFLGELISRQN